MAHRLDRRARVAVPAAILALAGVLTTLGATSAGDLSRLSFDSTTVAGAASPSPSSRNEPESTTAPAAGVVDSAARGPGQRSIEAILGDTLLFVLFLLLAVIAGAVLVGSTDGFGSIRRGPLMRR